MTNLTKQKKSSLWVRLNHYHWGTVQKMYCFDEVIDFVMDHYIYTEEQLDYVENRMARVLS